MNRTWLMPVLALCGFAAFAQARPIGSGAKTSASARASYRAKARKELDEFGRKIDALEASARRAGALARARIAADVRSLRADKADAESELGKMEAAGAAARKDFEARVERALAKLRAAYRKAAAKPSK